MDDNLLIVDLNPAAENVLGISRSRARGKSLLEAQSEAQRRAIRAGVVATIEEALGTGPSWHIPSPSAVVSGRA